MKTALLAALCILGCLAPPACAEDDLLKTGFAIYQKVTASDPASHEPITASLSKCLAARGDRVGMDRCFEDAEREYDRVLNAVFQEALRQNDKKTDNMLRETERKWLVFHKSERTMQVAYAQGRGTMMGPQIASNIIAALRARIAELMMYTGRIV